MHHEIFKFIVYHPKAYHPAMQTGVRLKLSKMVEDVMTSETVEARPKWLSELVASCQIGYTRQLKVINDHRSKFPIGIKKPGKF